ncbi:hypothetical protein [Pseudooceanicola algae]|uniref:Uncharacterized protein n=1 Tax=Pseudooceanicola algae TaxID=1537215 RepID=A0A418SJH5_9RHOB|nr:hypothetical protein [Pseudooceanicola algae]QPM91894.1 hypothetical protein PSAL_031560 [Pseudooceanicola algae]
MIYNILRAAAAAGLVALCAGPVLAEQPSDDATAQGVVKVSCFRGPFTAVIWDHPNESFVDTLMDIGFSHDRAVEIGERVCRDERIVDHHDQIVARTRELIASTPRN